MASGLTREQERELEAKIKKEFETGQPRQTIMIAPDWQPFETAPKDGRHIAILCWCTGYETPDIRHFITYGFWGRMIAFPDKEMWVSSTDPDNGMIAFNDPFVEKRSIYRYYGRDKILNHWHGCIATHWSPLWKIEVEVPPAPKIEIGLEISDWRREDGRDND